MKHRNSQKRIYIDDAIYFVTSVTKKRYPYFKDPGIADLFLTNLRMSMILKQFTLHAWFLGYDHFHALVQPGDEYSISKIMKSLKENSSRNINRYITLRIIRNDSDFENHFEYIKFNPEKHDMPKGWPYVSENPEFIDLFEDHER